MATRTDSLAGPLEANEPSWSLTSLLRRLRPGAAPEASGAALLSVVQHLRQLNQGTEKDFLAAGEELTTILATERQVTEDLTELARAFSRESGGRNIEALSQMRLHFQRVEDSIRSGRETFVVVRGAGSEVGKALSGLERILPELRAVGTATKIEAARLGAAGRDFAMVAEEVNRLTQQIGTDVNAVVEASTALNRRIDGSVKALSELSERQIRELPEAVNGLLQAIDGMNAGQNRALGVTEQMRLQSAAVEECISRLVTQLQFHDIVRQQIEHVIEAVEALKQAGHKPTHDTGTTLEIQVSQLENASATYSHSTSEIACELGKIIERVGAMAGFCRDFFSAGAGQESVFLSVEKSLSSVLGSYRECTESEQSMAEAARLLASTLRQMRESAASVDSIDVRMQRVALNATIRAAHIGNQGQALGVLADNIHALARMCGARAGSVVELLEKMMEAAAELDSGATAGAAGDDGSSLQVKAALGDMHSASEAAFSRLQRVELLCMRLEAGVTELRGRFGSPEQFTDAVEGAARSLRELAGTARSTRTGATESSQLAHLSGAYTMQKEREIHALVTGAARKEGEAVEVPVTEPPPVAESEFGDNVELF